MNTLAKHLGSYSPQRGPLSPEGARGTTPRATGAAPTSSAAHGCIPLQHYHHFSPKTHRSRLPTCLRNSDQQTLPTASPSPIPSPPSSIHTTTAGPAPRPARIKAPLPGPHGAPAKGASPGESLPRPASLPPWRGMALAKPGKYRGTNGRYATSFQALRNPPRPLGLLLSPPRTSPFHSLNHNLTPPLSLLRHVNPVPRPLLPS